MEKISIKYKDLISRMTALSRPFSPLSATNVYREANRQILPFIDQMIAEHLLEPSGIEGREHLEQLLEKAQSGASCLLLMEHFSNFDLPVLSYLLRQEKSSGPAVADALLAVAGMKLDEECPVVAAFAEAYRRIVISPSRSHKDSKKISAADQFRRKAINRMAARTIRSKKKEGSIVLVFPSGTRYRPDDPTTLEGRRETDTYIRSFDFMCLAAIDGNILRIQNESGMADDYICQDQITIRIGEVTDCRPFREQIRKQTPAHTDKKQAVADEVMRRLDHLHQQINSPASARQSA